MFRSDQIRSSKPRVKNQDIVIHRAVSSFSNTSVILLINVSQRKYRKIPDISAFLCVWNFMSSTWIHQCFAPVSQPFPAVHWRSRGTQLARLFLCLRYVPFGLSPDPVWTTIYVHMSCSGVETENRSHGACVQEGESVVSFSASFFCSPTLGITTLLVHCS